ncbi:GDNF-inducible zinc finger protein 1 [Colossoma macropomum]|uniref:GDNF-inducible zinc finger protein 1 n=1 Tax=Colossoma macropomum TaxID=42526 RepID=UPI001863CD47|nr:GDNF-inducible zinc finger protein 1 [Colossoma macropomum]
MRDQEVQLISSHYHENLLEAMWKLRATGNLCDITVQVSFQGELGDFEAHQVVLAATSGYFKTHLLADKQVKKLSLTEISPKAFNKFLEYAYSGKMEVEKSCLLNILQMAKLLECQNLVDICDAKLLDHDKESMHGGKVETRVKLKRGRSEKHAKKALGLRKKLKLKTLDTQRERKVEVQGRRSSSRLAGRRVSVNFSKKKTSRKARPQSEAYDPSLSPDETEITQEAPLQICETESMGPSDQIFSEKEALADSGSESACTLNRDVPDETLEGPDFVPAEATDETDEAEKECKTGSAKYDCHKCIRSFRYEKSYLKHVRVSHGIQTDTTYRCNICQQTFANRCNLKIHERHVHSDERLFPCDVCGKAFKRKKDVTRHRRQVHEGGTERHFCPVCGKSLSSKTALTLHERTHTGDKPYNCDECGARFSQSSALKTHQRIHTGEKPFACDMCDARFTQNHMLAYHKRCHTGEKPFMCENCGKSFASKEYLKHHARIHSGYKPYKCENCGRAFAQRNSLHQHMKIHTGERPYHCKDCDKQFTQLNALQRHQRIHTGEKPYMCSMCGRTFTDKSTVRRHTMTHDKDTPWKNYLVVLQGNVEGRVKKPKGTSLKKDKAAANAEERQAVEKQSEPQPQEIVTVSEEPVTIAGDWTGPGTIALVSHGALGSLTVIQTEVPAGTQLQPIVTADGASVISLDSSAVGIPVTVPFSIPISVAHSISESAPLSGSVPLSDPATVSDVMLAPVVTSATSGDAVTEALLAPAEVTLSASTECLTAQSEVEQIHQVQNSDSHQETTEHVQTAETVEAMEISTGDSGE